MHLLKLKCVMLPMAMAPKGGTSRAHLQLLRDVHWRGLEECVHEFPRLRALTSINII